MSQAPAPCGRRGQLFADGAGMTRMTHALWISLTAIGCTGNMMNGNGAIAGDAGIAADAGITRDAGTGGDAGIGGDAGTGGPRPGFTRGVSTLAGSSDAGDVDGGRDRNLFHNPVNVAYGIDGKLYVADFE